MMTVSVTAPETAPGKRMASVQTSSHVDILAHTLHFIYHKGSTHYSANTQVHVHH